MSIITYIKKMSTRMKESELESLINILEDERKRRKLIRDDEINIKGGKL